MKYVGIKRECYANYANREFSHSVIERGKTVNYYHCWATEEGDTIKNPFESETPKKGDIKSYSIFLSSNSLGDTIPQE